MQAIWVSNIHELTGGGSSEALGDSGSPFTGLTGELSQAFSPVQFPSGSTAIFGADMGGQRIPLVLLAGERVIIFDVCDKQPLAAVCAKCDRLMTIARRVTLFHKPSDGKKVQCALIVTGDPKLKPYTVHICQVMPIEKLDEYLKAMSYEGESVPASAWLAFDPKDGRDILSDRIDVGLERWSRFLLDGWLQDAADEMVKLQKMGYRLYLTTDYGAAKAYCAERYAGTNAQYGFITSSDAENMFPYGGPKSSTHTKRIAQPEDEGWEERWFDINAPDGCRTFKKAALESTLANKRLDFAVLGWGDDMRWIGRWKTRTAGFGISLDIGMNLDIKGHKRPRPIRGDVVNDGRGGFDGPEINPRLGSYYTLLTAARDGIVLFTVSDLYVDSSKNALLRAGAEKMF